MSDDQDSLSSNDSVDPETLPEAEGSTLQKGTTDSLSENSEGDNSDNSGE